MVNVFAGIAAFLLLAGFIGYMNFTSIQLHLASANAGFAASMPGYKPTGYALQGGVKAADNQVSLHFTSGDRNYTITEQASDWNSQTLLENHVALSSNDHETIISKGRTVYIYNGNNAVWVNGGVLYNLTGNAGLTADDISSLASSM